MEFVWDPAKSDENVRKHHLDFADAWRIFTGPILIHTDDRFEYDEVRYIGLGFVRDLVVVIVFSEPDDDTIRVISLRRALSRERQRFYEHLRYRLGTSAGDDG